MKLETLQSNKWWQRDQWILLLFIVIGGLLYMNSLSNSFHYDDEITITENRNIYSIKNIPAFFVNPKMLFADPYLSGGHYRPLVVTSFAINYFLGGLNPVGYHLVNLAFHVGSAFLIFLIVKVMLNSTPAALISGLIFLVHPFNSEVVNYIVTRFSVMSGFFYLLAFYYWMKFRSEKQEVRNKKGQDQSSRSGFFCFLPLASCFYIFSLFAFVLGMLSKEVVITLPIVLFLYDLYFHRLNWRSYLLYIPFVLFSLVPYMIIRISYSGFTLPGLFERDLLTQLFTELPVHVKYLRMFLIPTPLTPIPYIEIQRSFWSFPVISSAILLIAYVFIALFLIRLQSYTMRVISFFMVWFFIVLLPTTIIPLNVIFQENRGYLAVVSFAVIVGAITGLGIMTRWRWVFVAVLAIFITIFTLGTFNRNTVWRDELTLWSDAVKKAPRSIAVYRGLANSYLSLKMYDQAINAAKKALLLSTQKDYIIHAILGSAYGGKGMLNQSLIEFKKAVDVYPYFISGHFRLGVLYYVNGDMELATRGFRKTIRLDPQYTEAYFYLADIYTREKRFEEAINVYIEVLPLLPHDKLLKSRLLLGDIMNDMGRKAEAAEQYRKVVQQAERGDEILLQEAHKRLEGMRL